MFRILFLSGVLLLCGCSRTTAGRSGRREVPLARIERGPLLRIGAEEPCDTAGQTGAKEREVRKRWREDCWCAWLWHKAAFRCQKPRQGMAEGALINNYIVNGRPELCELNVMSELRIYVEFVGGEYVHSRDLDRIGQYRWPEGADREALFARFERIAALNWDTGFRGEISAFPAFDTMDCRKPNYGCCIAEPIREMHLYCDQDFGEEYPAGAPIDALVEVYSPCYDAIIRSGYTDIERVLLQPGACTEYRSKRGGWKRLDELTPQDLRIFPASFYLILGDPYYSQYTPGYFCTTSEECPPDCTEPGTGWKDWEEEERHYTLVVTLADGTELHSRTVPVDSRKLNLLVPHPYL